MYKIIFLFTVFFTPILSSNDMVKDKNQKIITIAEQAIKKHYPDSYAKRHEHEYHILNEKDYWVVSWKVRPGIAEGTPAIFISKKTLKVIKHKHYQ